MSAVYLYDARAHLSEGRPPALSWPDRDNQNGLRLVHSDLAEDRMDDTEWRKYVTEIKVPPNRESIYESGVRVRKIRNIIINLFV